MSLTDAVTLGLEAGRKQVEESARRKAAKAGPRLAFQGYLILEGDSWFHYPVYDEITEVLRDRFNYKTRSAAHYGDTAQEMAYLGKQLSGFEQQFADLASDEHVARAILLSCGGNDVMDALSALMNPKGTGPVWHPDVVKAVVHEQVPFAISVLIGRSVELSERYFEQKRPIVVHGYGNPVPDGRGYKVVVTLVGPWMKPVFARKGYVSADPQSPAELEANRDSMAELMTVFNDTVLPDIVETANRQLGTTLAHYVDVRSALSSQVAGDAYENDWGNEIHPTGGGFEKVASLIHDKIVAVAPVLP